MSFFWFLGFMLVRLENKHLVYKNAMYDKLLGRVVRKPVSANPGLKVNRSINFSSIKMFFTADDLFGFSLVKLKAERQTVERENLSEKLQY